MTGNDARGSGRYLSLGPMDRSHMLEAVGVSCIAELFDSIPESLRFSEDLEIPAAMAEIELQRHLAELAARNAPAQGIVSYLGAGCYPHFIPSHLDDLLQRQEFMTAYTPYQAEISQGTLQTMFEFQSLICLLTGMDICNASMYDGGSAVAEAILMARRLHRTGGRVLCSEGVHPAYMEVARTYATHLDVQLETVPVGRDGRTQVAAIGDNDIAVLMQQPNFFGVVEDVAAVRAVLGESSAKLIVATSEPLALGLVVAPGDAGADLVVGELQSFGNAPNYGGPLVGFLSCRQGDVRNLPGRLAGETLDSEGKRGYVLTLATREQHIRRANATSNICTNTALCALATCIYLCSLGRVGLRELAHANLAKATYARRRFEQIAGISAPYRDCHFNEFVLRVPGNAADVVAGCVKEGIVPGVALGPLFPDRADQLLVCVTELHDRGGIDRFADVVASIVGDAQ